MIKNIRFTLVSLFVVVLFFVCSASCDEQNSGGPLREIEYKMLVDGEFKSLIPELKKLAEENENSRIYLDLAFAYYGLMQYNKAIECFDKAEQMGVDSKLEDILKNAKTKIEENIDFLNEIQDINNALGKISKEEKRKILIEDLTSLHLIVLNNILGEKYYYPSLATPHIIWLKQNVDEVKDIYVLSANIYYAAMMYAQAVKDYKKAIECDPGDVDLYRALGDVQVALGDLDNAQDSYDKAIELYEKQGVKDKEPGLNKIKKIRQALPAKYEDINALIEAGRFDEAEGICKERISLNPGDYAAITQLGEIYWERNNRKKAIAIFRKVIKKAPDYPLAYLMLGKAYVFERKYEKGIEQLNIFKEKMELLPEMNEETKEFYISALHYMTYIYSIMKMYKEMAVECKKILELDPEDQKAHYNLAVCYYVYYNNRPKTYSELRKIIEIDENTPVAEMAKFYIDFIRRNPNSRMSGDFTFINEE